MPHCLNEEGITVVIEFAALKCGLSIEHDYRRPTVRRIDARGVEGKIPGNANYRSQACEICGREVPGKVGGKGRKDRGSTGLNYLRALNAITCTATFCPPLAYRRVVSNPR